MLTYGFVLIAGLVLLFIKLPRRKMLWLLGHSLALDVGVVVLMTIIHWGTFSGVMAAAAAGLFCSIVTSLARWCVGYTYKGKYTPGKIILDVKEKK